MELLVGRRRWLLPRVALLHACAYLSTLHSFAAQPTVWHPLVYKKTTGGFDDHDATFPAPAAMCSVANGVVRLKGTAQCVSYNTDCWSKGETAFGTLPLECGPVSATTVKLKTGPVPGAGPIVIPVGSDLRVSSDGTLTLVPARAGMWMLRLDDTQIPLASGWGGTFLLMVALGAGGYVGAGILYAVQTRGNPLVLRSHPHAAQWQELRRLCADGARFARARAAGRPLRQPLRADGGQQDGLLGAVPPAAKQHTSRIRKEDEKTSRSRKEDEKTNRSRKEDEKTKGTRGSPREGSGGGGPPPPPPPPPRGSGSGHAAEAGGDTSAAAVGELGMAAGGGGRWVHVVD